MRAMSICLRGVWRDIFDFRHESLLEGLRNLLVDAPQQSQQL
jgi:hypothetical protein